MFMFTNAYYRGKSPLEQDFACDIEPFVQGLIIQKGFSNHVFESVFDMDNLHNKCVKTGEDVMIRDSTFKFGGWSCIDNSILNSKRCDFMGSMGEVGQSAQTLNGITAHLSAHPSLYYFGEMVPWVHAVVWLQCRLAMYVCRQYRSLGYISTLCSLCMS
jgi:hypothetical protein